MNSIVIAGSLAQKPGRGGHTWVFLQYVLGFLKLGWDVTVSRSPRTGHVHRTSTGARAPIDDSANVRYFLDVMQRFGLEGRYGLLCDGGSHAIGLDRAEILERVSASAALINVMGFLTDEEILAAAPRRVFLDIDPGFGQMWRDLGPARRVPRPRRLRHHRREHRQARLRDSDCGLEWVTTRQPVVIDEWPDAGEARGADAAITSVASWRGAYGPVEHEGTTYTLRVHEFRKFASLPRLTGGRFEVALDIHPADAKDIELLAALRLVAGGAAPRRGRSVDVSRLHPPLGGGSDDRQGHVRPDRKRLVQRPQHLLSRQRPAGARAGHGPRRSAAGRRRPADVHHASARPRKPRARSIATTRVMRAPRAAWRWSVSSRPRCWAR